MWYTTNQGGGMISTQSDASRLAALIFHTLTITTILCKSFHVKFHLLSSRYCHRVSIFGPNFTPNCLTIDSEKTNFLQFNSRKATKQNHLFNLLTHTYFILIILNFQPSHSPLPIISMH